MSAFAPPDRPRAILSFSRPFAELAAAVARDLTAAHLEVRYDAWSGGGGVPAHPAVATQLDDAHFLVPLLTPSDVTATWIGEEWKGSMYDPAVARGIPVLPLLGEGDLGAIPEFLRSRSVADLRGDRRAPELRRLLETIRSYPGAAAVQVSPEPSERVEVASSRASPGEAVTVAMGRALAAFFAREGRAGLPEETIRMMQDGLHFELGVHFPEPRWRVDRELPPWSFRVLLHGVPEAEFEFRQGHVLVSERVGTLTALGIRAERGVNPATGGSCAWVPAADAEAMQSRGVTVWDEEGFVVLALAHVLRERASVFIGLEETRGMLEGLEPLFPHLVAETVPGAVSLFLFTDVLRRLVAELVSIRNLRRILLTLNAWAPFEQDPLYLTEHVRAGLRRQLTHQFARGSERVIVLLLHPQVEETIRAGLRHLPTGSYLDLQPDLVRRIVEAIRAPFDRLPDDVQLPHLLTPPEIRSCVRRLIAPVLPHVLVVSYQEFRPDVRIHPIGRISLDGFSRIEATAAGASVWEGS